MLKQKISNFELGSGAPKILFWFIMSHHALVIRMLLSKSLSMPILTTTGNDWSNTVWTVKKRRFHYRLDLIEWGGYMNLFAGLSHDWNGCLQWERSPHGRKGIFQLLPALEAVVLMGIPKAVQHGFAEFGHYPFMNLEHANLIQFVHSILRKYFCVNHIWHKRKLGCSWHVHLCGSHLDKFFLIFTAWYSFGSSVNTSFLRSRRWTSKRFSLGLIFWKGMIKFFELCYSIYSNDHRSVSLPSHLTSRD